MLTEELTYQSQQMAEETSRLAADDAEGQQDDAAVEEAAGEAD